MVVAEPGDQGAATALHALAVHGRIGVAWLAYMARLGMQHMPRIDNAAHTWHA
jgi:hypothetical protein